MKHVVKWKIHRLRQDSTYPLDVVVAILASAFCAASVVIIGLSWLLPFLFFEALPLPLLPPFDAALAALFAFAIAAALIWPVMLVKNDAGCLLLYYLGCSAGVGSSCTSNFVSSG